MSQKLDACDLELLAALLDGALLCATCATDDLIEISSLRVYGLMARYQDKKGSLLELRAKLVELQAAAILGPVRRSVTLNRKGGGL